MTNTRAKTSIFNKDVLTKELSLTQFSNTTIFKKKGYFFLSPAVQNEHWWFDLRKVNLEKFDSDVEKGYLLIRLFDKLLICNLEKFMNKMILEDNCVETKNSGIHWKFNIIHHNGNYIVVNQKSRKRYLLKEVSVRQLKKKFNSLDN